VTPGKAAILHEVPLAPALNGLVLRGQGYRTSIGLISNTLFWMVVALATLTVWMLLGTWRHMRRRLHMQSALLAETNFRRAMENSMLTGMRAMDMESRIAYVNPAFCAMTGFTEAELIGCRPPFPYWPRDRLDENQRLLDQEMQGRSPSGGIELKVMRKDGSVFDARQYVSPLVDAKGKQTGWMTSMTNITEAKRVRDQLSASHERFTTVLEGLDAAVSVLSIPQQELLFANRSYRLWFGAESLGHTLLAEQPGSAATLTDPQDDDPVDDFGGLPAQPLTEAPGSSPREVFVESLERWFDVRTRYLQWTDGRLAQMLIATDITARRAAEQQAEAQAAKSQMTSRLVTMGEMASSVAHELNQPLTAITNYCNGMMSRVRGDTIAKDDLLAALEKTSKQAQRAGQVIQRIRAFVKRSEPQRQQAQAADIVEDAVDLASIELRRRNVQLHVYVAQRLPALSVDPILIEQVLLNLLKNAAEAIDGAKLPPSRRHIELRVVPRHMPDQGGTIEFAVQDAGPGLPEEVISRMFEAFFSTKTDGLGIGLGLCRSIVESHHGRLRAENLYNGRAHFGLPFRVHDPRGFAPHRQPLPERHHLRHHTMSLIPKKGNVFVVDDDEAVRDSLQWLLEGKDYRVKCFDSAESFLARFDPREVACLICDIRMDGMSGLELQDKLIERKSPLPMAFITGHGDVPMAVQTMKKGATDFIEKPFKEDSLVALVEKMLDQARSSFASHQEAASRDALLSRLTTREAQVLERIVAGRLNKQIADDLGISIKTVEAHRANIMEKLNANTVADLLKIALGATTKA
jgi:PAS domain S-box-containing protein